MPSKKKRKLEVEDGSPDIPVLRALREELSLPYLPELFYPNEGDDEEMEIEIEIAMACG